MTGLNCMLEQDSITLILSPLSAIEEDQARELRTRFGEGSRPFILNGDTNRPDVRHQIARGHYTHIWTSAEIALGELAPKLDKTRKKTMPETLDGLINEGAGGEEAVEALERPQR